MAKLPQQIITPTPDECSFTIDRFCLIESMSKATYHKLKRMGLGPQEVRVPGLTFVRITPAARREWHARMDDLRKDQAHQREVERRSAARRRAGKIAAASPNHYCRRQQR